MPDDLVPRRRNLGAARLKIDVQDDWFQGIRGRDPLEFARAIEAAEQSPFTANRYEFLESCRKFLTEKGFLTNRQMEALGELARIARNRQQQPYTPTPPPSGLNRRERRKAAQAGKPVPEPPAPEPPKLTRRIRPELMDD